MSGSVARLTGDLRRAGRTAASAWASRRRWVDAALRRGRRAPVPRVYYGRERVPGLDEQTAGGGVKFQRLQAAFPNAPGGFDVLYLGSSDLPPSSRQLLWLARFGNAAIVWNQNGVAYPGWHGAGWEKANEPMVRGLHAADHVFFQSAFCKLAAERFLGATRGTSEILYNAVDTRTFAPASERRSSGGEPLMLLLGGTQYWRYRLEVALETVALLHGAGEDVCLRVTGEIFALDDPAVGARWALDLAERLGIGDRVELLGRYSQAEAPAIFRSADVLLHTKYNDPCPGVVVEAMACGLPVVYSASGGVPELVGDAGIGVPAPLDWEQSHPPYPEALAEAVVAVAADLDAYAAAARRRAVEHFDIEPWIERHRDVFAAVVERDRRQAIRTS